MDDKKTLAKTTKLRTFNDQLQYPKVNNLRKKKNSWRKKNRKVRMKKKSSTRSEKNASIRSIFSSVKELEDVQRSASPPVLTG